MVLPVQLVVALALTVVLRAGPDAGAAAQPSVEAELDALLAATARKTPSAEVVVVVEGPDPKVYRLEEATVHLDGAPLPLSNSGPGAQATPLSDGDHVVSARLVYRGQRTGPYPWEEGPRWALPARVALQASRGLRFSIRLVVETNAQAPTVAQRLTLRCDVEPQMLVAVDDAPLPPPPVPQASPTAVVAPAAAPLEPAAAATAIATPPKKKPKKKVARATRSAGTVPASAAVSPAAPAATAAAAGETTNGLEEATARLRRALAAPGDAGVATPSRAKR